ncbi:Sensor protein with histidine kinase domain [Aromatoleum aromaticum EbN1]|uniref:histidine kinase n=2 Tax=Aromatoleum aromaticum TaxID=551760 RepID=Q5P7R0_AROAE|nr:Sensor protein with histidine kinase domain [Aromatoleum aromaticum EbN1]
MRAVLRAMMGNRVVESAFTARDRNALTQEAGSLFQVLRADHLITHLYFIGHDLVTLLRLHSPNEFGDEIHRATMLMARDREQTVRGLELGPMGTLTLRLVMPWRQGERVLGYLEIGQEIEHLLGEIRASLSVDLLVLVDKRYLLPAQWARGLTLMDRSGDWERFGSHVPIAQTVDQVPQALTAALADDLRSGRQAEIEDGGRALHLAMLPLEDAGGRRIGDVLVVRDITELQSTFRSSMALVTLLCLLAAAGVLGLFYYSLERVERDYRRQHDLERQLLRIGSEHQRMLQIEKLSALGTMVGGVAHQLNNPLVGVVNMAQLATREVEDPERTRELLGEIRRAGEDCRTLVRRMLEFSKVSSFESKRVPMAPLIEETVLLFRQTGSHRMPVDIELPDQSVVLRVDPILIRHALFNLLLNAAQATANDAAITIALERETNTASGAPGWSLSVSDRGTGIARELIDKVFEPFFTTRAEGTGLGLPVVQHVALMHEGQVTVSAREGGGTRFALWLHEPEVESASDVA